MFSITCLRCFIGKPGALFAWHVEDKFLASLNYGHHGKKKVWWAAASSDYAKVVQMLRRFVSST